MPNLACSQRDHKNVRLFSQETATGWTGSVYDLDKDEWIYRGGWSHERAEAAQKEAIIHASSYLREEVPEGPWLSSSK